MQPHSVRNYKLFNERVLGTIKPTNGQSNQPTNQPTNKKYTAKKAISSVRRNVHISHIHTH